MVLGYIFKRIHVFSDAFTKNMNSFVFKIALPVLVFQDLSVADFKSMWDGKYVLVCFGITVISILLAFLTALLFRRRGIIAEFVQASFRSSAALLGIGIIQNIYGHSGYAPLMIIGAVPLYNVTAVILLSVIKEKKEDSGLTKAALRKTLLGIVTNPIILGILVGIVWSLLKIPQPVILQKMVGSIAGLATPMGLMALGASFTFSSAKGYLKPAIVASVFKLIIFCAIFLPLSIYLGYREDKLIALLIMLGSPTTVSCFIMAKNMDHEGTLSASTVMITTLFSAFTLTAWLYLLKCMGVV